MLRSISIAFIVGVSTLALAAGGCSSGSPDSSEEGVASAVIAITNAPSDVRCVQILVQGTRSVEESFDVLPGQTTQFQLNGLPAGMANFSGNAFDVSCASVDNPDFLPNWVADPVPAQLQSGAVAQVNLPFRRNVRAQVNADFEEDGTCQTNGAPCSTATQCCSAFCVDGTCQAQQCTPDGQACTPGDTACCSGTCGPTGICGPLQCLATGASCAGATVPCCAGVSCVDGVCGGSGCSVAGSPCGANGQCCSGLACFNGVCQSSSCSGPLLACQPNIPCCSGLTCSNLGAPCQPGGCQVPGLPCADNSQCCSLFCDPLTGRCF
jgi:hypothetical protein